MKKTVTIVLILIFTLTLLAGCGSKEETLDGKWVIDEIINPDGSKTTAKEVKAGGVSESYEFNGDKCHYICETTLTIKPIEIDYDVVEIGSNKYELQLTSSFTFCEIELKKDKLIFYLSDGSKFYYKKAK